MRLPQEEGWMEWQRCAPLLDLPIEITRDNWPENRKVVRRKDLSDEFNRVGLFWRPTGIYREAQRKMSPEVHQQLTAVANPGFYRDILGFSGEAQHRFTQQFEETT